MRVVLGDEGWILCLGEGSLKAGSVQDEDFGRRAWGTLEYLSTFQAVEHPKGKNPTGCAMSEDHGSATGAKSFQAFRKLVRRWVWKISRLPRQSELGQQFALASGAGCAR